MYKRHTTIHSIKESDLIRHRAVLRVILLAAIPASLIFSVVNYSRGHSTLFVIDIFLCLLSCFLLYKSRTSPNVRNLAIVFSMIAFATILFAISRRDSPVSLLAWIFVIPVLSYSTLGRRYGFLCSALFICISMIQISINAYRYESGLNFYDSTHLIVCAIVSWALAHVYETARENAHTLLVEIASTDPLTGVNNRVGLEDSFHDISNSAQHSNQRTAVVLIDLDHFKKINDTRGHPCGDEVLRQVAIALKECVHESDQVFRIGGEEFCLLISCDTKEQIELLCESLRSKIAATQVRFDGEIVPVSCSIGAVHLPPDKSDLESALKDADNALYNAKTSGRNRVLFA